jgi:lipopolysaccharide export system permease protein
MNILDRYVGGKFLSAALFSVLAFLVIFVVVDVIERLDTFIDKNVPVLTVVQYYLLYAPFIVVLTLPVAMLLASLFSISSLSRHQELAAMKAAGLSLYRILLPLFVMAFLVSLFCMLFGEFLIPYTNELKGDIWKTQIKKKSPQADLIQRDVYLQGRGGLIYYVRQYDGRRQIGQDVLLQRYEDEHLVTRIDARQMVWEDSCWVFRDGLVRRFTGQDEKLTAFQELRRPDLTERPEDFLKRRKDPEEMNYQELLRYIHHVERSGGETQRERVDLYLKIAFPFASFIIVLFGAPLASSPRRSGAAVSFGISLFICFIYYSTLRLGQALGYKGALPPALSAWLGNIVFGAAGLFVLWRARK